jgi:hypothetical protein
MGRHGLGRHIAYSRYSNAMAGIKHWRCSSSFFLVINNMSETKDIVEQQKAYLKNKPVYSNFRAWTSGPNTELTDLQEYVRHTVAYDEDGKTKEMEILAICPMDALDQAHEYLTNQ